MKSPFHSRSWHFPLVCAGAYFIAAKLSLYFVFESHHIAAVWLPNGVLLGLLWPHRRKIAIQSLVLSWGANAAANLISGHSLYLSMAFATVNILEVLICLQVLRRLRVYALSSTRRIFIFLATTTMASGLIGVLGYTLIAYPDLSNLADHARLWHTADAWGLWIAVPIVHSLRLSWGRCRRLNPVESFSLLVATLSAIVLSAMTGAHNLAWLPILLSILMWSIFRFGPAVTMYISCGYNIALIWATAHGVGPFIDSEVSLGNQIFTVQLFLGAINMCGLITSMMIREREQFLDSLRVTQKLLQASIDRFTLAVKGSQSGIWDWNLVTHKVYYSPPWKQMLGYEDHELGNTIEEWESRIHPEDIERVKAELQLSLTPGGKDYAVEFRLRHRDGTYRWILSRAIQIRDEKGQTIRMAGSHVDVSEYKRIQTELKSARDQATSAARVKSDFLANMSHEIRTPLNGIVGIIDLLSESTLSPEQQKHIGVLKRSTDTLRHLINDVLDFSKIEAGKLTLESVPFSLQEWTNDTVQLFTPTANQKGIALAAQLDPQIPARIVSDPARYRQILSNLISNALKFTSHGFVNVSIVQENREADAMTLHVRAVDSGIGIPLEKQSTLFQAFSQADTSTTRRFGGSGLGLAISSQLVKLLGGRIWVESSDQAGSTFHFTWPVKAASAEMDKTPRLTPAPMVVEPPISTTLTVLLVDDNDTNQLVASTMIKRRGHQVDIAANGQEAVDAVARKSYDVVFMDCQMPVMDGVEATRRIRESEQSSGRHLPIVALTASALETDRARFKAAGMDDYLDKPIDQKALHACLERIVDQRKAA